MDHRRKYLLEEKIGRLIINYSIPAMIGMMVMAFYNLIDTIFVGHYVGKLGIAGVAIVMPYNTMVLAMTQFIAIGSASVVSRSLGSGDNYRVNQTFNVTYMLAFIAAVLFTSLGRFFIKDLIYFFGATDLIFPFAYDYLNVMVLGSSVTFFIMISNNMIRSEGNAKVAMFSMVLSAVLNIFLDALFIVAFGMGMTGAAVATVLSQVIAAVYVLRYFWSAESRFDFGWHFIKPELPLLKEIFSIGSAAFARQSGNTFMNIVVNQSLRMYGGELLIAAYGIIVRLLMFPIFGIVQGLMPVLGMNYGAGEYRRSIEAIDKSARFATVFSSTVFIVFMLFPGFLVGLFSNEPELIDYASHALVIITLGFATVGYQSVGASLFQSLGKGLPSFFLSLLRQVIFLIPLVLYLPVHFGTAGILYSFVISDILSFIITYIVVKIEKQRLYRLL